MDKLLRLFESLFELGFEVGFLIGDLLAELVVLLIRIEHIAETTFGVDVRYCGHDASFAADIYVIKGVAIIRAAEPISEEILTRPCSPYAKYWFVDSPECGFWQPSIGVFAVPVEQVTLIQRTFGCEACNKTFTDLESAQRHAHYSH